MGIAVHCDHCGKDMKVKDSFAGKRGLCPFCNSEIQVPFVTSKQIDFNEEPEPEVDPPTKRQLNYARKLGIATAGMSKDDVSAAISDAEAANPSLGRQREQAKADNRAKKYGPELIQLEQHWQKLADADKWIVAVYQSGKSVKVDVIRVNGASLTDKGVLELECEIAKIKTERYLGQVVDLGRYVELAFNTIKWHEVIDAIEIMDVATFQAALQRGQNAAGRMGVII